MLKTEQPQNIDVVYELPKPTLDPALELMLERVRIRAKRRVAWLRKLWSEEGQSGGKLAVTHAEIDTHLENRDSPEAESAWLEENEQVRQWNCDLAEVETAMAGDKQSRLSQLQHIFGLSSEEFDLFQCCLAVLLDPALARVYAYLHDHAARGYATEELASRLFGYGRECIWTPESSLCRWELVKAKEVRPGESPQLACDALIRDWLQGSNHLDETLVGNTRFYTPVTPLKDWPVDEAVEFIKSMINANTQNRVRMRIVGPPGSGRRTFASIISSRQGLSMLAIDTDQIDEHDWQCVFVRAQRQAYLDQCAIAWYGENAVRCTWPQIVPLFPVQFIISEEAQVPSSVPDLVDRSTEMPVPSVNERKELWRRFLPISITWPIKDFNKLVTQHRVNVGDIISLTKRDVQSMKEATDLVREASRYRLGKLAQLLECPFNWDDLVVTDFLREALEDLIFEARERVEFWERNGALRLFPQGRALLALFNGPPGTGKTMAAQVIAASLGLDLFRIDLSAVVSKYVGETSQNLERILSRASRMDVVLLFDEADALFGKRTEIKDAHDRFANTDTGYLLQAIENYRGVALLATNRKDNVDTAFIRRIRYLLDFPKPDAKQREQIWQKVIGELAGVGHLKSLDRDLESLAVNMEITGAQIKFAVLAALFAAKRDGKPLAMKHLLRGLDRELMKEGRALSGRERKRLTNHER